MPDTNPFLGLVPRKMTNEELARAIRLDIQAELDAVNLYQAHIDATDDEEVKLVIAHVRDEEKEHVGEFLELLRRLDPKQAEELDEGAEHVEGILAGTHPSGLHDQLSTDGTVETPGLTVGDLRTADGD
jgi:uncharacterized protein